MFNTDGIIVLRVAIVLALAAVLLIGNYFASKNKDIDQND